MMSVWLLIIPVLLASLAFMAWPLWRPRAINQDNLADDLVVLKAQRSQIDEDLLENLISEEEADKSRNEMDRRILRAADKAAAADKLSAPKREALGAALLTTCMGLLAVGIYLGLGKPDLPSRQLMQSAQEQTPDADRQRMERARSLIAQVVKRLEQTPDDLAGWLLLGRTYAAMGEHAKAAEAFGKVVKLQPDHHEGLANLGEAMVLAAGEVVTRAAHTIFERLLQLDAKAPAARYYLALYDYQNQRPRAAYDRWLALLRDLPADSPGRRVTLARLERVAGELSLDIPEEMKAAQARSREQTEQDQMIRQMVARLAERLEEEPEDVEGWVRLGRSYAVLGQLEDSARAYGEAAKRDPQNPDTLSLHGRALIRLNQPGQPLEPETLALFNRLEQLQPENREALWYLGLNDLLTGKAEAALQRWRKLRQQFGEDSEEYRNISDAIADVEQAGAK